MTLSEIVHQMGLEVFAGGASLDRPVKMVYSGDMLSDVLAHAHPGELWITTMQGGLRVKLQEAAFAVGPE